MQLEETSHQEWRFLLRVMMGLHAPMEDAADIRDNTEQLNSPNSSMSFPKPTPMLTDALGTLVVRRGWHCPDVYFDNRHCKTPWS